MMFFYYKPSAIGGIFEAKFPKVPTFLFIFTASLLQKYVIKISILFPPVSPFQKSNCITLAYRAYFDFE